MSQICWPKLESVDHAQTAASEAAGSGERKCFVYKWVTRG